MNRIHSFGFDGCQSRWKRDPSSDRTSQEKFSNWKIYNKVRKNKDMEKVGKTTLILVLWLAKKVDTKPKDFRSILSGCPKFF